MLDLGVIEESKSSWSSPVVLVQKPGKVRLCIDSRKLNDGILSRLPKAEFITSLDLKDAFWQIPLDSNSRDKTAFCIPGRPLYQFKVMPFGLTNSPHTMSRLIDKVVPPQLRNEVFIYLDDLLIVSDTFERHMAVLSVIAEELEKANLTINVEKSKFCLNEVKYLGHVIGNGIISTDPEKIVSISEFPTHKSMKQVRRFLGMTGWYHKFIQNYAALASPLTDTLKNKRSFNWSNEAQKAFEELKLKMSTAPVLHSPDFSRPFSIHCDASNTGVGAVLMQENENQDEIPISFMSRKLNKCQRNYTTTEKECLAAVLAVKKFRAYIEGQPFNIITDHASLKWLMSQADLSSRLARWALKLQGFVFKIIHRKGSENLVPDSLSRIHTEDNSGLCVDSIVDLESAEFDSEDYKSLREKLAANPNGLLDIKIINKHIYRRAEHATADQIADDSCWKIWLPANLINKVLKAAHEDPMSSHCGINKTIEKLRRFYFWPNLVSDVRNFINGCSICKCTKHPNQIMRPPMGNTGISERVFQKLYVDFLGPYPRSRSGNIGIFVVLDHLSKFPFLKTVKKFTVESVIKFMEEELFHCFGVPETVVSDNGVQFKSNMFNDLLKKYNVKHVYTAFYSPQANASERVNRSVLAAIKAYIQPDQKNWDEHLSSICCALRSSLHSAIGTSPYRVAFGQHMVTDGGNYQLLRELKLLDDRTACFSKDDSFELIRKKSQRSDPQPTYSERKVL